MNSQKAINLNDLIGITKKYELLKTFQDSEDFKLRTRINLYDIFLERPFYCGLFTAKSRRKNMIKKNMEDYEAKEENINIDDEYDKIYKEIQKDYLKIVIYFFAPMKQYGTQFLANKFELNQNVYGGCAVAIGYFLLNKYEGNIFFFDKNSKKVILNLSRGINNRIEDSQKLSEEWE